MHLAIRADGGPERGYGHLVRTGHLARAFTERRWTVTYLTRTPDVAASVCPESATVVTMGNAEEPHDVAEWVGDQGVDIVLTDHYDVDQSYQRALRDQCACLVVRHGYPNHALACDILLYGNLFAEDVAYEWDPPEPRWCLGPAYLLLDPVYATLAQQPKTVAETPKRILVTMGGSDVGNLTPPVLRALSDFRGSVDVIIGPGYDNHAAIRTTSESISGAVTLHEDPENLPQLMFRADMAVTALGTTAYELLATATPFVGVPVVDNQNNRAAALDDRDLAVVLDSAPGVTALRDAIDRLSSDIEKRRRIIESDIVDGRGSERVANVIIKTVT